jgi:hypothetical protein
VVIEPSRAAIAPRFAKELMLRKYVFIATMVSSCLLRLSGDLSPRFLPVYLKIMALPHFIKAQLAVRCNKFLLGRGRDADNSQSQRQLERVK